MTRTHASRRLAIVAIVALVVAQAFVFGAAPGSGSASRSDNAFRANHPAIGSWFGKAVQLCTGEPATNCAGLGLPAVALFMTPTFHADGTFLGNDSLALAAAPFGPHTTAHGNWIATSRNTLVADIVFMLNPFPPADSPSVGAVHIKYAATVTAPDTMVGYVNLYFFPPLELSWEELGAGQFPTLPDVAAAVVAAPGRVFTDPAQCKVEGCPLVFKFTVRRVGS